MAIRKRLTLPRKLAYHRLFGSLELPPAFDLDHAAMEVELGDNTGKQCRSYKFPRKFAGVELKDVALGLIYHRHKGVGPGQGFTVWVNKRICFYRAERVATGYSRWCLSEACEWEYIGEFVPKQEWEDYLVYRPWAEMKLWYQAKAAIIDAYENIHGVALPVPWVPHREHEMYQ